jgi:hypothetical protein
MFERINNIGMVLRSRARLITALFLFYFSMFYYAGYKLKRIAADWIWMDEFDLDHINMPDIDRLMILGKMLLRGDIARTYTTLWAYSPILVSLLFTLVMISFSFAMELKRKEGKRHIGEYVMAGALGASIAVYLYNKFFVWS